MKKYFGIVTLIAIILLNAPGRSLRAASNYEPPFEMYGVVKEINQAGMSVHIPHINKNVMVQVPAEALITNRIKDPAVLFKLSDIKPEDLVVINGVVREGDFISRTVSFLPMD